MPPSSDIILGADVFKKFIDEARNNYDYILIDAPPVLFVSDPLIISRFVDGVILIVAMEETKKIDLINSKDSLIKVGANIVGLVLTKTRQGHNYEKSYYYES